MSNVHIKKLILRLLRGGSGRPNLNGHFYLIVTGYRKTFIKIMVSLKFHCQEENEDFIQIEVSPSKNGLFIEIDNQHKYSIVNLDKSTAIKFSKELRKQIALID